ncbi:MAG: ABC transporter ATP-binding protein [SAR324 cluster bacterium]|nr:ABC transporter ATP-binding protein [SAR324 cluster bacterium]MBL7035354.1 ABC transporter ATP-binding protein [SAR324 cluster bacterium]
MSADVTLENITVKFDDFTAVNNTDITIKGGEFFSFLGPSGCGKTTLLRVISGFQEPSQGRVLIGGNDMTGIGPNKRPTALIFQNLALFPLMTVWENIAFSLEVKGVSKTKCRKRAEELLELVAMPGQGDKMVNELSGGQRQRVAVARALAAEPEVLLLDEPLSALDLKLRQHMRTELREIQQRAGITFIYITHDQGEALTMSDRVAVMREGVIEQVEEGTKVYDKPVTAFVASFVGENNAFHGTVSNILAAKIVVSTDSGVLEASPAEGSSLKVGDKAIVFARPEAMSFVKRRNLVKNVINTEVVHQEFEGHFWHLILQGVNGLKIKMSQINDGTTEVFEEGKKIKVQIDPKLAVVLPSGPLAAE